MARFRRIAGVLALAGTLALVAIPVQSAPAGADDRLDNQVEAAGEALDAANAQVAKALKRYRTAERQLTQARQRSINASAASERAFAKAQQASAKAASAVAAVKTAEEEQERLQGEMDVAVGAMNDIARVVYQQGPLAELEVVLDSQDPGDMLLRLASVNALSAEQERLRQDLMGAQRDLAMEQVRLEALKEQANAAQKEALSDLDQARKARKEARSAQLEVFALTKLRKSALADARSYKLDVARRYEKLRRQQARIARLAAQAAAGQSGSPTGDLLWPIDGGGVSEEVGPRVHPVYGYASCHTGIDIRGGTGTPIRAAASGTVLSITNGGPYGLATLVIHDGGLATFYAHQSRVRVKEGDRVEVGQVIGEVGSSGWVTGPHLHFEVRIAGKPYDPRGWFGRAKEPVNC
mgnify:CR=1 FL=1